MTARDDNLIIYTHTQVSMGCSILACYKSRQPDKALELFAWAQRQSVHMNVTTISILIELLDDCGLYDQALYIFDEAVAVSVADDCLTSGLVVSH